MPGLVVRLNKHLAGKGVTPGEAIPGWRCQMLAYNENAGALRILRDARIGGGAPPDAGGRARAMDEIESILRELTDAETGARVLSSVTRPSAEFPGARAASLPDLLVHYEANAFPRALSSPRLGPISTQRPGLRPGNHAAGGFLIATGDTLCATLDEVHSLADLGPQVARALCLVGADNG